MREERKSTEERSSSVVISPLQGTSLAARTPTLSMAVETFVRLELEIHERSPQTVRWYRERMETMCAMLGADRSPESVLDVDLLDWLATLRERRSLYGGSSTRPAAEGRLSVATLRGYVRAARRFWRWLHRRGFIESNPALELPMPPKPRIAKRGITDVDQEAILKAAHPPGENVSRHGLILIRDYAILEFLCATGCRLGGLAHLTLADVRLDDPDPRLRRRVYVIEKGNKGRFVFVNREAEAALRQWLAVRPACQNDHVFTGCANGQTDWHALHEGGLYEIVKRYAERAGVKKPGIRWSPHQWRHRFGRRWLENGGDLSRLAQLMGHSTSQITSEHYGQLEIDVLQDGYEEIMDRRNVR